jgi:3-hydroxyacyl-[acyl-carrier-protein] dehydratase
MPADTDIGIDLKAVDFSRVLADKTDIGRVNPHRHEMAILTGVVHIEPATHLIVAYADTSPDDFWVRGHFPQKAVMPGVIMCEAAAQLCSYYSVSQKVVPTDRLLGLGGLEDTRFRGMVRPGERLVMVARGLRVTPRITKFAVNGFVPRSGGFDPAFESTVIGVILGKMEGATRA